MPLVTFRADVAGYCRNDVVNLDKDDLALVDAEASRRKIDEPYVKGDDSDAIAVEDSRDRDAAVAAAEKRAAKARAEETQATIEAQAASVPVPAVSPTTSAGSSVGEAEANADQAEADAEAAKANAEELKKAADADPSTDEPASSADTSKPTN